MNLELNLLSFCTECTRVCSMLAKHWGIWTPLGQRTQDASIELPWRRRVSLDREEYQLSMEDIKLKRLELDLGTTDGRDDCTQQVGYFLVRPWTVYMMRRWAWALHGVFVADFTFIHLMYPMYTFPLSTSRARNAKKMTKRVFWVCMKREWVCDHHKQSLWTSTSGLCAHWITSKKIMKPANQCP